MRPASIISVGTDSMNWRMRKMPKAPPPDGRQDQAPVRVDEAQLLQHDEARHEHGLDGQQHDARIMRKSRLRPGKRSLASVYPANAEASVPITVMASTTITEFRM